MKTPEEILNEVATENMINIQQMVTTKQLAIIAMRRYAKLYHESKVKNLDIQRVSQQRELLKFFSSQLSENLDIDVGMNYITEEDIEECLKNFNCG
ncbi:hypothetical protein Phi13:2_gp029 [Cellulophaga phage phi13:2]|uniref:Uncharacterized protein n=1 Tax=Cellulophaga phage phi13:2 TaxID=1328030 RepID=S0A239_9CAUD|nr:hypothetical protein Phi13:2_gp029 [Cellulophaga phage phi13:2]AGO49639.1 hypothetical protein Phi13:2_gp029 [Cellulophaga phage phi13:2]